MSASNFSIHLGNGVVAGRIFYLLSGLFPLLIGAAIFHALATWRSRRMPVDGENIGVRRRGLRFHVVSWMALLMLRPMVLHAEESPAAMFEHTRSVYQALNATPTPAP